MAWDSEFVPTNDEWEVLRQMRAISSGKFGPKGGEAYQQALAAIMDPKIPALEETWEAYQQSLAASESEESVDPSPRALPKRESKGGEDGRQPPATVTVEPESEESVDPSPRALPKRKSKGGEDGRQPPASENTRLDPGSGTEEAGKEEFEEEAGSSGLEEEAVKEVERPSLPKIPAEEDTRLDPGSSTEEADRKDGRIERGEAKGQEESGRSHGGKRKGATQRPFGSKRTSAKGSKDAKEIYEAIEEGRKMLWAWAGDHGMPDAQKRQNVVELLARWNPEVNRHIPPSRIVTCDFVFSGLQDEVNIILAGRAAEEEAEEEAGSSGTEEESEEEEAEEEADWDFEDFGDYEEDSDEELDDEEEESEGKAEEEAEEEAGSSAPEEEAFKEHQEAEFERDTRLDPGSGTAEQEAVKQKDAKEAGAALGPEGQKAESLQEGGATQGPEKRPTGSPAEQCKYFGSAQGCKFGADCVFKHEDPTFVGPCKYQAHGHCKFEGRCFFRHTDLDKPKKEKQNDARGAAAEVAAKEAEAAWRYAAEERRKGYDEGFEHGAAFEKAKAEGFEQGVAFARDCAKQAARATAEEGEQRKAATESRKAAEERLAALASETATALQKKGAQDKELAKAEEAKAKAKKRAKEEGRKQERKKKREQADAQGPPVPKPPCPLKKTTKARWSPSVAKSALALLLGVLAAYSGAAQEQGSSMATERATRKVTHHQTTALSRFLSDDARYEARPDYAPSKTQNREVVPLWRICWACLGVGLFLGSWRTSGFYCGRTPATAGWRTVRAAGFVARCATRSARLWKPWLRLESGAGSGSCERSSGAWGAGRADLPAGRSAPAAPD
jgi:hypothetical protein